MRSVLNRHGATIATVLLLVLLAWLITRWVLLFRHPAEVVMPSTTNATIDLPTATEHIVAAHVFGIAGERKALEETQVSALNLHLKGVFAFDKESPAFAIVNT